MTSKIQYCLYSLLSRFKRNSSKNSGCLFPGTFALVYVSEVLSDAGHLFLKADHSRLNLKMVKCLIETMALLQPYTFRTRQVK